MTTASRFGVSSPTARWADSFSEATGWQSPNFSFPPAFFVPKATVLVKPKKGVITPKEHPRPEFAALLILYAGWRENPPVAELPYPLRLT